MARRARRQLVLTLDRDLYALLEAEAARQERDPWAQARWMLARALRSDDEPDDGEPVASSREVDRAS